VNHAIRLDVPPLMQGLSFSGPAAGKRGYVFGNADPARGRGNRALNVTFSDFDPGDKANLPVTIELTSPSFDCAALGAPDVGVSLLLDAIPACAPPAVRLRAPYDAATCTVNISAASGSATSATYPELSALMPCLIFAFAGTSTLQADALFNLTIRMSDIVANQNSGPAYLAYGSIAVALNFTVALSSFANSGAAASALFQPPKTPLDPWPGGDAPGGNFRESAGTPAFAALGLATRASALGGGAAVQMARVSLPGPPSCGRADALLLSGAAAAAFVAGGPLGNSTTARSVSASAPSSSRDG